ncbi:MAG: hypothetical protein MPW15_01350 [Candidatus Manganitrophus sp.]|nr:hypothetical protein [Candidatus Manganitrophus sp.]
MAQPKRPLIGQILIEKHGLTPAQLEEGLRLQKEQGGKIGEILVRLKALTEDAVLEALSQQWQLPYRASIDPKEIDLPPCREGSDLLREALRTSPLQAGGKGRSDRRFESAPPLPSRRPAAACWGSRSRSSPSLPGWSSAASTTSMSGPPPAQSRQSPIWPRGRA